MSTDPQFNALWLTWAALVASALYVKIRSIS